ncbi:hypothetical protein DY000_02053387 [Brassica cretica]|uniref:Uncharacterized protein n=1 Tax=Brassica cretica TaxID=69181 RepID=A0ABQ7AKE8_BRACR|nr:hypothetical protein DY000_02053387 [Brassica cretica]
MVHIKIELLGDVTSIRAKGMETLDMGMVLMTASMGTLGVKSHDRTRQLCMMTFQVRFQAPVMSLLVMWFLMNTVQIQKKKLIDFNNQNSEVQKSGEERQSKRLASAIVTPSRLLQAAEDNATVRTKGATRSLTYSPLNKEDANAMEDDQMIGALNDMELVDHIDEGFDGVCMPSSTRSNKNKHLLFSEDPAHLKRTIRKDQRSTSLDAAAFTSTDSRTQPSTDIRPSLSTDLHRSTSIDTTPRTSIDHQSRNMVAIVILRQDENGNLYDQDGHLRNATESIDTHTASSIDSNESPTTDEHYPTSLDGKHPVDHFTLPDQCYPNFAFQQPNKRGRDDYSIGSWAYSGFHESFAVETAIPSYHFVKREREREREREKERGF